MTLHRITFVIIGVTAMPLAAVDQESQPSGGSLSSISEGGFEFPALSPGTFAYQPDGAAWSFSGSTGISRDNSAFTSGNPIAPEGQQVLFLQDGTGNFVEQTFTFGPGTFRLHLKAAQRANVNQAGQTFRVLLDGQEISQHTPKDTNYADMVTSTFTVTGGPHTIRLEGLNPLGGDNTAFIDDLQLEHLGNPLLWSSPSTWISGSVPGPGDDVTIPAGSFVLFDQTSTVRSLTVNGALLIDSQNLTLDSDWVMVGGLFQCGTAASPHLEDFTLTLTGLSSESVGAMGGKFFGIMPGGRADVHGIEKLSWTQLGATAEAGATDITLKEPVDWSTGDEIIIASTDFDAHQAEKRTITSVDPDGLTINFSSGLSYMHWGTLQHYDDGTDLHTLDERAEVGLLSRNILIQGNAASESDGFGGHLMAMPGSEVYFDSVELYRLGQKSILARYPFHWHNAGNVAGQYLKNCGIHRSFNRVVTVHNTDNALIEGNVGYDHIGHGFFLEDGGEVGNMFRRNLGILTRKPTPGEEVRPHDLAIDGDFVKLPSTFWITNPSNHFIDNAAAGSEGSGFWMVILDAPVGSYSGPAMRPGRMPMGTFTGNRSHSNSFSSFAIDGGIDATTHELSSGHYRPRSDPFNGGSPIVIPEIRDFTGFKCRDRCLWFRADSINLYDCALADNGRSTFFAYNQVLHDSLIVGRSANIGNPQTATELSYGYSLPLPSRRTQMRGHSIYDGPCGIVNVHFAGFDDIDPALQTNGAAQKSTVHFAEGITFDPAISFANKVDFTPAAWRDYMWSSGLIDRDGSITGTPGTRLTPDIPDNYSGRLTEDFNREASATLVPEWGAWLCPNEHYGLLRLDNRWPQYSGTPIYAHRSDGPAAYNQQTYDWYSQNAVIVNSPLNYRFQYLEIANRIDVNLRFVDDGDELIAVFPNMPAHTYVYRNNFSTPLPTASSLSDLESSTTEKFWFRDNTLHVKLIGDNGGYNPQFGNDFSSRSSSIRLCQFSGGANSSGRTDRVTLADFEMGVDNRGSATSPDGLTVSPVIATSSGPGTGPFDATDDRIAWTVTSDGDGLDEVAEYRLNFPRQIWADYDAMNLSFSGPRSEILVVDQSEGEFSIGVFDPTDSDNIRLGSIAPPGSLDEVVGLVIRCRESDWSSLGSSLPQTIELLQIELIHSSSAPYSVSFSPDLDNDGILNVDEPPGDLDGDGLNNEEDTDSDGDNKRDDWELARGRDPYHPIDLGFEFETDLEGFSNHNTQLSNLQANGGFLTTVTTGGDGYFWQDGFHFPGSSVPAIHVKMRSSKSGSLQCYWARLGAPNFSESRIISQSYSPSDTWQLVTLDHAGHSEWNDETISSLRFDPINKASATVEIDWIRSSDGDMDQDGIPDATEGTADPDGDGLFNLEDPDSDNDGALDKVENLYGRNPYADDESSIDSDGDGQTDLEEMIAGHHPDDASDSLKIHLTTHGSGPSAFCRIHLEGKAGRLYHLEASADLSAGNWSSVRTISPSSSDSPITIDDTELIGDHSRRFLRVVVSHPAP
ncbi:G8 domain-containing protein [Haloferula rosea]|uniref:G8 domain-containing protein n=1 Tax=Haloferula rosea TaxID=490093 RepID=A0A934RHM9_9BACT|nr:G8 domain-containing protein [Haloferula rosea]MBK1828696.1 hypothetical protein [Haloferula rosea]